MGLFVLNFTDCVPNKYFTIGSELHPILSFFILCYILFYNLSFTPNALLKIKNNESITRSYCDVVVNNS